MAKLEGSENIENYLTIFKRLATACKWPKEDWAIQLVPLLTGKVWGAFIAMVQDNNLDDNQLKGDILKKYEINTEICHLQFKSWTARMRCHKNLMSGWWTLSVSVWPEQQQGTHRDHSANAVSESLLSRGEDLGKGTQPNNCSSGL